MARNCSRKSAYRFSIWVVLSSASFAVAWMVWPSCHKNSLDLKNGRVVFCQDRQVGSGNECSYSCDTPDEISSVLHEVKV